MSKIAIYPGSFDPVTLGHEDLIHRSLQFVDELIVAIATNPNKRPLLTLEERLDLIRTVVDGLPSVRVESFDGLLAQFADRVGATMVIRGLRAMSDFEFEYQMALMNRKLNDRLETVFLVPDVRRTFLSSSLVREVAQFGGDVSSFVHPSVDQALRKKFAH
ncbi:MAG: pantetheine-phosphate adenylyltransferase [Gemmatimonadales bacterium]